MEVMSEIRSFIEFIPSEDPVRKHIRFEAIGNVKLDSTQKMKSKIDCDAKKKKSEVAFRGTSKAGNKPNVQNYFKKSETQITNKITKLSQQPCVKQNTQPIKPSVAQPVKNPVKTVVKKSTTTVKHTKSGLGMKRKLEKPHEEPEANKRSKKIETKSSKDEKINFNSNLYSLQESSEEPPVEPQPFQKTHTSSNVPPQRESKVVDNEEEEMDVDNENVSPNTYEDSAEPVKANSTKIKTKVKKKRTYLDEDGFEVTSEYSEYEEIDIDISKVNLGKTSKMLESKKSVFKQPEKGQKSISSFFGKP